MFLNIPPGISHFLKLGLFEGYFSVQVIGVPILVDLREGTTENLSSFNLLSSLQCHVPSQGQRYNSNAILLTKNQFKRMKEKKKKEIQLSVVAHTFSPYTEETKTRSL